MNDELLLPFRTARLLLRPFTATDAPALAAYRSDPDVARFQDWDLPFSVEDAEKLIAGQAGQSGPERGGWYQIAIEHDGELVGDLALGLDDSGQLATLGYSLRSDRQGSGFATEAAEALIDRLFESFGIHRVAATLDPANIASARLLERLGFRYEGRGLQMALVRGEWCDDDRYALLRSDRDAWLARPRTSPDEVRLVEITHAIFPDVYRLATHHSQERFVAPVPKSFADALIPEVVDGAPLVPWYRAVDADGELVGFVMCSEVTPAHPEPFLWRLLVDRRHQRRGIGTRIIALVIEHAREQGATTLMTSWVEGPGSPAPLYLGLGFEPTGDLDDDEVVARLRFDQPVT
ncbi:MAG: GNAT family N-acetyltransferase [Acidimicrobiia bacterium]